MRFLQEMIAKKKHMRDGHALAEAPDLSAEDMSAQDLHENAFGESPRTEDGAAEPSILPYRVPVEDDDEISALNAFREKAGASLDIKANGSAEASDDFDDEDDGIDASALSYDESVGAQHATEEEGRDELEYVDHFAGSTKAKSKPAADPKPAAPEEDELDPALASFFRKEAEPELEAVEPDPVAVAPVEAPAAAQAPSLDAAPQPTPEPADEPVMETAEDAGEDDLSDTPLHPALADHENEPSPDASLFFDKPAEDRLMERTNEILASSTQAEAATALNGAAAGKKIWDLGAPGAEPAADQGDAAQPPRRRASRVKTRLLGFNRAEDASADPFAHNAAPQNDHSMFPVGWIIVIKGPGRGACFTLFSGASKIGRGEGQPIRLNFGDTSISRDNHAAVAYDDEQRMFYLGHGGKANLVRLNDMPVLSTEPLNDGDLIRIGETTLRFVALCGEDFAWPDTEDAEGADAQTG